MPLYVLSGDDMPSKLRPSAAGVAIRKHVIKLTYQTVIADYVDRICVKRHSEDALRAIIAHAKANGWTGLKVAGRDE